MPAIFPFSNFLRNENCYIPKVNLAQMNRELFMYMNKHNKKCQLRIIPTQRDDDRDDDDDDEDDDDDDDDDDGTMTMAQ